MSSTHHHSAIKARLCPAILAALLVVALPATAFAAAPTTPALTDVYVDGAGFVTVEWSASTDADGDPVTYTVYRLQQPITATNVGSATAVASSVSGTSVTVSAHADEIAQSYVWFYAVRATDGTNLSLVSKSMAPNLHGYRLSSATVSCTRCHEVHGAYPADWDYTYVDLCYSCHGATSAADATGAKSSLNVEAEFGDYDGQTQPASVHRSTKMETDRTECDACHSAHRSPYYYDNSGNYVAANSYRKMIRVQTGEDAGGPLYTYYSYNDDTLNPESGENAAFCLACHGADATPIGYVGDADDYAGTGGDHNSAGYSAAAHGPSVVYSNDHGRTNASEYPQVQCLACHAKHASAADKLIAYRGDDATASPSGTYAEAELCFACHNSASGESSVAAGYAAPFSWNDRDVKAEFGRTSAHPVSSSATGRSLTCASCHNVHNVTEGGTGAWSLSRVSTPSNTKNTPADMTAFCLGCHTTTPPSATIATDTLVPYRVGFSDQSAAPYFPGWDKSGFVSLGAGETNHYTPATGGQPALCKNCHDPHGSDYERLVAWTAPTGAEKVGAWTPNSGTRENDSATASALSSEENLCYQCHGNGTTGQRADGAKDVATKAGLAHAHDPSDTTGAHSDTESGADIGKEPHAECTDCHDPHMAKADASGSAVHATNPTTNPATNPATNPSAPGAALYRAWGAAPNYRALNWDAPQADDFNAVRFSGEATDMEAYLCFKCHSQNIGPTMIEGLTDTALEFNPSNFSVHNVTGQSIGMQEAFTVSGVPYTWKRPADADFLVDGWTADSAMTCTDCHTNTQNALTQAQGPHGSAAEWLIDPAYPNWTSATYLDSGRDSGISSTVICAKCHYDLDNANQVHNEHTGRTNGRCQACHTPVPHGWKRPRLLAYTDDPLPYRARGTDTDPDRALNRVKRVNIGNVDSGWEEQYCNGCNKHKDSITDAW